MKLSDHERARSLRNEHLVQVLNDQLDALLEEAIAADLPPFCGTAQAAITRDGLRADARDHRVEVLRSIECDHCGTTLVNPSPGSVLLAYPPRTRVACLGCGWSGTMVMGGALELIK